MSVLFLIILMIVVIGYFIMPGLMRWFLHRQVNKVMERMSSGATSKQRQTQTRQQRKQNRQRSKKQRGERIIPPEYAIDVEYTETKIDQDSTSKQKINFKVEEQVSDAEWVEI